MSDRRRIVHVGDALHMRTPHQDAPNGRTIAWAKPHGAEGTWQVRVIAGRHGGQYPAFDAAHAEQLMRRHTEELR